MSSALADSRSNTLALPSASISESIPSGTGQQSTTSHEPSFVDSVVLALTTSRDRLGCAYFHQRDRTLYYLQDAVSAFRVELYSEVKQQVLPTRVILDSGMGPQFLKGIKEAERATNCPAQVMVVPPGDFSKATATSWLTSQGLYMAVDTVTLGDLGVFDNAGDNRQTKDHEQGHPLSLFDDIEQRLNGVAFYASLTSTALRNTLRTFLKGMNGGLVLKRLPGKLSLADWQGLAKFLEKGLQLLSTVSHMKEHPLIIHQRISALESGKLHKVLDRIQAVIDFKDSKHENRVVVNQGFDKELDNIRMHYGQLESFLHQVKNMETHGWPSALASSAQVVYYPQLGFLLALPTASVEGEKGSSVLDSFQSLSDTKRHSIFLCDEFGKGTAASDGVGLLTASLQYFLAREQDAPLVVVCTHFQARRVRDTFTEGRLPDGASDSNRATLAPALKALEGFLRNGDCSDLGQVSAFATKWLDPS
ncbi:MutS protein msh5 [Dispira parvispora]|uniref:MutS protein msh5 n=1 Tax=Dispira parvispora TaxID=1520584 RepID=A0A9W8AWA7_9FUNG|nr:MutS protein msh5 [Dispira parvispora]